MTSPNTNICPRCGSTESHACTGIRMNTNIDEIRKIFEKHSIPEGDPDLLMFDTDAIIKAIEALITAAKIETLEEARDTLETWYQTSKHHPIADMNEFANKMFEHRIKKEKK